MRDHGGDQAGYFVLRLQVGHEVGLVDVVPELRVVTFVVQAGPLALAQVEDLRPPLVLALLDLFLPQGGGALGVFDLALRLLSRFAFLPLKVLAQRADLLVQLLLAFLNHRGYFLAFAFELLDLLHGVPVWHERLDRYKFPEFGVLDVVLAVLVEVFLV